MQHSWEERIYHLLTTHESYDETRLAKAEQDHRQRTESRLRAQARVLGFQLVPVIGQSVS